MRNSRYPAAFALMLGYRLVRRSARSSAIVPAVPQPPRRISSAAPGHRPAVHDCFAAVAPGLEAYALAEAVTLGLPATLAEGGGGVEWRGDLSSVLRANLGLRIASRVLVRVAAFEATSFAALEREARRITWAQVVPPGATIRFRVTCRKSRLYHSDAVAQRIAAAVLRALPGVRLAAGAAPADDDDAPSGDDQLLVVRMFHDRCTVSADTSGALLHRRGWRLASARAPMRETLAAGLLAASGWDGTSPLVDPFCGSGTIPIEAALRARGVAPGLGRAFAVERWPALSRAAAARARVEIAADIHPGHGTSIAGADRDAGAIESSAANAERAGVAGDVAFAVRSISALALPEGPVGWIVANPPYGVRVGDAERVRDLWARFGAVLRERGRGWTLALLSPDAALERQLGIPLAVAAATTNGGIPVRIVVGRVP